MHRLSSRSKNLSESVTLKLNALAVQLAEEGKEVFNLTAGQLPFRPNPDLIETMRSELDFLKSYQYSPVGGFPNLKEKVLRYIAESRGIELEDKFDVLVSNGGKHSLSNILGTLVEPGDEVIILAPYWISYPELIRFYGGTPVEVSSNIFDVFTPKVADIKKAITNKTKAIIINSPSNPSGIIYNDQWMSEFAEMATEFPEVSLISDEIYFELNYYDPGPTYFYQKKPELLDRTIIVDGISKSQACTGLRIGYTIAEKSFVKSMAKMQGQTASGANSLVQRSLADFDFSKIGPFLKPIKNHLRQNAETVKEKLREAKLSNCWYQPTSAFYFLIDLSQSPIIKKYQNGNDKGDYAAQICEDLLKEHGVAMVPGTDFGMANTARISLVSPSEQFEQAISKLVGFMADQA